jgi:hypothetical protein
MKGTFEGLIKQLDITLVGKHARRTVARCFPEFERQQDAGKQLDVGYIFSAHGIQAVQSGRRRRYAGGSNLPIARYYSVCSTADGNDKGTLCYELMTYWSYGAGKVYPSLFDTSSHPDKAAMIAQTKRLAAASGNASYRDEVASLIDSGKPLLIITPLRARESIEAIHADTEVLDFPAVCELSLKMVSIPDCLDLRLPAHREFFCRKLTKFPEINAHKQVSARRHKSTIDFIAALAHLILPDLGGDVFHQHVGQRLREWGYNGLVFPSARNDSSVVNIGDKVVEHSGWNFVDYRNAGPPSSKFELPERIRRWPPLTLQDLGVEVYGVDTWKVGEQTMDATGFFTDGVAQQEWARIERELSMVSRNQTPGFFYDRFTGRPID